MDDTGQVGRVARPGAGQHFQDPLPKGRIQRRPHRGVVGTGGDRVHLYVVAGVLAGQEPTEGDQAPLAGGVGRPRQGRSPETGVGRGDVHDLATSGPAHARDDLTGTQVGAGEVDFEDATPKGRAFLFDSTRAGHPGVVHQHGRVAESRADGGEGVRHRFLVGHVTAQQFFTAGPVAVGIRVEADDGVAAGVEAVAQSRPDGAGCSGDDDYPAHGLSSARGVSGSVIHSVQDPSYTATSS